MRQLFPFLLLLLSLPAFAIDLTQVERDLQGQGATGWIHGAVKDRNLFVFTVRDPKNFFDFAELSLTNEDDPAIRAKLATFGRHDFVRVKGSFLDNPSPQKHIQVTSIELVQKFSEPYPHEDYRYAAQIPDDLLRSLRATFLVHAVAGEGKVLVLEYKDQVVPMFAKNPALTKDLFRGDVVEVAYKIQRDPGAPTHLALNDSAPDAVRVVESIRALHGKPAALDGELVLFPKSPEIKFNIFAVLQKLPSGSSRQYTLVNFDDPDTFAKIRAKLQQAWDKFPGQYENGRNKLVSKKMRVRAKGTFNEISPAQANPQILLNSADDIEIYEK